MKQIITLAILLAVIPSLAVAQTNILGSIINESGGNINCYNQTNPISDLECTIGDSAQNFFGTALIASIFVVAIGIVICWKAHLPLDLVAIFIVSLLVVANLAFGIPTWVIAVLVLLLMLVIGLGFYHYLHSRN